MSRLQKAAKPAIVALLNGWAPLNEKDQSALAAWATMFTMVYEYADPATVAVTQEHRDYFMRHRMAPPGWTVWVGKVDLKSEHPAIANHHGANGLRFGPAGLPEPWRFQSTGFTVGSVFFQTLMIDAQLDPVKIGKQFDLRVIHPFRGPISGDPAPAFLDRMGFFAVSNAFAQALGMKSIYVTD